jgi:hypothetical protein
VTKITNTSERIFITLPIKFLNRVRERAEQLGISLNDLIFINLAKEVETLERRKYSPELSDEEKSIKQEKQQMRAADDQDTDPFMPF